MRRVHVWIQRFADRPNLVLQWLDPDTGGRKSKSAKTADQGEAEKARADLEYELNHGLHQERSRLKWERFREMFEDEYLPGLRPRSAEKLVTVLDVFEETIKPSGVASITERTLSQFVRELRQRKRSKHSKTVGLAPITIRNYLVAMKTALGWAVGQKLVGKLPAFPTIKVPKKKPQAVPAESFEKLLDKAPTAEWKGFLLCAWWAGLRLSEALNLQWERSDKLPWVDLEGQRIVLPAEFAKGCQDQWVPLHGNLRQALTALPRSSGAWVFSFRSRKTGARLTRVGATNHVLMLAKKAGVKLSMQKLRKGFGTRMANLLGRGGAPVLHELMRHTSMQITMDYYANVDDGKVEAMQRLT
jgi:integrase